MGGELKGRKRKGSSKPPAKLLAGCGVGHARCLTDYLLPASCNLGVTIDSRLTMADHVSAVCRACYFQLRQLRVILNHPQLTQLKV